MKLTTYTPEFRAEAVKLVLAQGLSLDEAAKRIAIPKGTLARLGYVSPVAFAENFSKEALAA